MLILSVRVRLESLETSQLTKEVTKHEGEYARVKLDWRTVKVDADPSSEPNSWETGVLVSLNNDTGLKENDLKPFF